MKRLSLLLIGLLLPVSVSAKALSPWLDDALKRIDQGISLAQAPFAADGSCSNDLVQNIVAENRSLLARSLADDSLYTLESTMFHARTLCLESDRILLQKAIKRILDALDTATRDCNQRSVFLLRSVYSFSIEVYAEFLRGSLDPLYHSPLLEYSYNFESSDQFDGALPPKRLTGSLLTLCPFSSEYIQPSIASVREKEEQEPKLSRLGCDETVLATLPQDVREEAEPLENFYRTVRRFAETVTDRVRDALSILQPTEEASHEDVDRSSLPHAVLSGCQAIPLPEDSTDPLTKEEERTAQRFTGSSAQIDLEQPSLASLLITPLNDHFSIQHDYPSLLQELSAEEKKRGRERPLPPFAQSENMDGFSFFFLRGASADISDVSENNEQEIGILEAMSRSALEERREENAEFESALQKLQMVTQDFLPKQYIPNVTYFLLRSCIDGACQKTLETVAQRSFNEYCYPYASGRYTETDVPQKCFCTPEYANEPYCQGTIDLSLQPPAELQCGEKED